MSDDLRTEIAGTSRLHRWRDSIILVIAISVTFLILAAIGARQAARDERVLGLLDPVVGWIRAAGSISAEWLVVRARFVGWITAGTAALVALAAMIVSRGRAVPLVLLAAAVSLVAWGQVLLLADRETLAVPLYIAGIMSAVALGAWWPLRRLDLPARGISGRRLPWRWECVLIFGLIFLGLLTRLYALTELSNRVDTEMIESIVSSRTLDRLCHYLHWGFQATSIGFIHLLPNVVFFKLFGASFYTMRLTSVLFGVAAIPLLYALVRRLAGVGPAVAATLLLIAAPEQLFWSRNENANFIPIAVLALVSAHLGLWMVQRWSAGAVFAAALWAPMSRYFYQAGLLMFIYPALLGGHVLLFVRGAWRKAWYVVPLLAGGLALWFLSVSILSAAVSGGEWHFIPPVGANLLTRNGELIDFSWPDVVRRQLISVSGNLLLVLKSMAYRAAGFSQWYVRIDPLPAHVTIINVGITALSALGLGYLLGQFYDPTAFTLLIWVVLGLLPGVLSNDPADRRIATVYPGLYTIGGVMLGVAVHLARQFGGRWLARVTAAALGVFVIGVAWTSLVSHFLLQIDHFAIDGAVRFVEPLIADGEVIVDDLDPSMALGLVFGNLDRFVAPGNTPAIERLEPERWLSMVVHPRWTFSGPVYETTLTPERVEALRANFRPRHVTFVLEDAPHNRLRLELLRALYPRATIREHRDPAGEFSMSAVTVDIADIEAVRAPWLRVAADQAQTGDLAHGLLADVALAQAPADGAPQPGGVSVQGGLLLERAGWYRFGVGPQCAAATLSLDHQPAALAAKPMGAGVHSFEITLPSATACELPLHVLLQASDQQEMVAVPPDIIVGARVASLPDAQAPLVTAYEGYGEVKPFGPPQGTVMDFGVDASGRVSVLWRDHGVMTVSRFDPGGQQETTWQPRLSEGQPLVSLAVDSVGGVALSGDQVVRFYDRDGNRVPTGTEPWTWTAEITFWRADRILKAMPDRNAIVLIDRDGHLRGEWGQFAGGPGRFEQPMSVTVSRQGDVLVIQRDEQALLFHNSGTEFQPVFVATFRIDMTYPPGARSGTFDGDRILLPDPPTSTPLVYNFHGERMMAASPERDPSRKGLGDIARVEAFGDRLYVGDRAGRLWVLTR
jgi:hypothetical protein